MPIQATFQADFTDFQRAVEQADVSLRGLETNAAKVEGSLNRMVDSFSGRKVISEATMMVEAVERIGGASKLTEAELARVSATAAQAAEKMRALGVEVPPGMQELADRTKHVGEETSKTTKLLGALAGQLAAMFTVSSVIAFGKAILDNADAVQKMADQTGLLTDEVQALMYISGQTGTSTDALTSAMQKLNEGFGSGDRGLVAAVRHLGLNFDDLRTKSPYAQLTEIADAIATIEDPAQRAASAFEVFGRQSRELMPAIVGGMKELGEEAPKTSERYIKAMDEMGDAWNRFQATAVVAGGTLIGILKELNDTLKIDQLVLYANNVPALVSAWRSLDKVFGDTTASVKDATAAIPPLTMTQQTLTAGTVDLVAAERELKAENDLAILATKAAEKAAKDRAAAEKEAVKEFEAWIAAYTTVNEQGRGYEAILAEIDEQLVAHIQSLLEAGASVKDLALAYSLTVPQVQAAKDALDDYTESQKLNKAAVDEVTSLNEELYDIIQARSQTSTEVAIANIQRWASDYRKQLEDAKIGTQEAYDAIEGIAAARIQDVMVDWDELKSHSRAALQETADHARANYEAMIADSQNYSVETIQAFEATAIAAQDAADQWGTSFSGAAAAMGDAAHEGARRVKDAADQAAMSWSQAMDAVRAGEGTMSGQVQGGPGTMTNHGPWGNPRHAEAVQRAYDAGRYFGPVVTRGTGSGYGPGYGGESVGPDYEALGIEPPPGAWTWQNVGPLAAGGPVSKGSPYLVGERGPELFLPDQSGTILPHGAAGATVFTNVFHINGTGADVARVVTAELTRLMRVGRKWPAV